MFVELPWLFLGLLVGLVISAIAAPPTRKEPRVPEPHDTTVQRAETGCVRVQASEVPCTADTDSLNLLAAQHK